MDKTTTNPSTTWEKEFRSKVYEPEHTSTVCWCEPEFIKNGEGNLEIVHNEQRDTLTEMVSALLSRKEEEVKENMWKFLCERGYQKREIADDEVKYTLVTQDFFDAIEATTHPKQ